MNLVEHQLIKFHLIHNYSTWFTDKWILVNQKTVLKLKLHLETQKQFPSKKTLYFYSPHLKIHL